MTTQTSIEDNSATPPKTSSSKTLKKTFIGIGILITVITVIAIVLLLIYFSQFNGKWGDQEVFGQFGDFLGGVLNPVLGFATIILLVVSLSLQMEELSLTRAELKAANCEAEQSRKAMQAQVSHLQKEAKLNEMTRVMADLRESLKQILNYSYPLNGHQQQTLKEKIPSLVRTRNYEIDIKISDILYDSTAKQVIYNTLRESIAKEYNETTISSNNNHWANLEIIIGNFSNVALMYFSVSNSPQLAEVYLTEALNMLKTLKQVFESELISNLMDEISYKLTMSLSSN